MQTFYHDDDEVITIVFVCDITCRHYDDKLMMLDSIVFVTGGQLCSQAQASLFCIQHSNEAMEQKKKRESKWLVEGKVKKKYLV